MATMGSKNTKPQEKKMKRNQTRPTKADKARIVVQALYNTDDVSSPLMQRRIKRYTRLPMHELDDHHERALAALRAMGRI